MWYRFESRWRKQRKKKAEFSHSKSKSCKVDTRTTEKKKEESGKEKSSRLCRGCDRNDPNTGTCPPSQANPFKIIHQEIGPRKILQRPMTSSAGPILLIYTSRNLEGCHAGFFCFSYWEGRSQWAWARWCFRFWYAVVKQSKGKSSSHDGVVNVLCQATHR